MNGLMKSNKKLEERIDTLVLNNQFVSDPRGHLLNEVRIEELRLIRTLSPHELFSRLEMLKKLKTREGDARFAQVQWTLKQLKEDRF